MNVTYCDLCQKPITRKQFRMTLEHHTYISHPLSAKYYDLCEECHNMIVDMMEHKTNGISVEPKDCKWAKGAKLNED